MEECVHQKQQFSKKVKRYNVAFWTILPPLGLGGKIRHHLKLQLSLKFQLSLQLRLWFSVQLRCMLQLRLRLQLRLQFMF